jgi:chorismate lyase / 3-hydroxybenzoate synthase
MTPSDSTAPSGTTPLHAESGHPEAPVMAAKSPLPALRVSYDNGSATAAGLASLLTDPHVLAIIGFGDNAPTAATDSRYLRVPLQTSGAMPPFEVWRTNGVVSSGREGLLRWATDGEYAFGAIELAESQYGAIEGAAQLAYQTLVDWLAASATPHALRIWNYLDAINLGDGDAERYRLFCSGRAAGIGNGFAGTYPAATAIGVRDGRRVLQIYWLAARRPGAALENPRQLSAWRYPRQYGPQAPSFARAMRAPTRSPQLYISGTAAIVGHTSHHHGDFSAQLDETLANIESLMDAAQLEPAAHFGAHCLLKAYVRLGDDVEKTRAMLQARLPAQTQVLVLQGDVCRSELLIEIDGVQGV